MMKRLIPVATATFLTTAISMPAFAHSELQSATPGDGETITEATDHVTLTFGGKIEDGSDIDVTDAAGETIDPKALKIDNNKMTVTFDEPLDNSTYKVNWDIISGDGHTLMGEYSFTVDAPVEETAEEATEEKTDTAVEKEETAEKEDTTKVEEKEEATDSSDDVTGPSTGMLAAVFGGLIVVIGGGLFFLLRKK
jgi:copper resistance protein C